MTNFKCEHNEEIGHYGQTLVSFELLLTTFSITSVASLLGAMICYT